MLVILIILNPIDLHREQDFEGGAHAVSHRRAKT